MQKIADDRRGLYARLTKPCCVFDSVGGGVGSLQRMRFELLDTVVQLCVQAPVGKTIVPPESSPMTNSGPSATQAYGFSFILGA
jgi:hypothetical protein